MRRVGYLAVTQSSILNPLPTLRQMSKIELHLMGPPSLRIDGKRCDELKGIGLALLTYLLLRDQRTSRDHLARLFWPGQEGKKARHSLRQTVYRLRRSLPPGVLLGDGHLRVDGRFVSTDLALFHEAIRNHDLATAITHWRGPFLDGFQRNESWELEEWLERERSQLEEELRLAVVQVANAQLRSGDPVSAIKLLEQAEPLVTNPEELSLLRIQALASVRRLPEAHSLLGTLELDSDDERLLELRRHISEVSPEIPVAEARLPASPNAPSPVPPPVQPQPRSSPRRKLIVSLGLALPVLLLSWIGLQWGNRESLEGAIPPVTVWFCSERESETVFRMNGEGGEKESLGDWASCPVVPVNRGRVLVALSDRPGENGLAVLRGSDTLRVTLPGSRSYFSLPIQQAGMSDGVVSPDGRLLVLTVERPSTGPTGIDYPHYPAGSDPRNGESDIALIDLTDGSFHYLTQDVWRDFEPRFTPDGRTVIFSSERTGNGDIYSIDLETRELHRLTFDERPEVDPTVGPGFVAFIRGWGKGPAEDDEEIVLVSLEDGTERYLTENGWNDTGPEISPGGKKICWTSKEQGHWESEIVVMDLITDEVTNISQHPGRDEWCQWHPTAPVVLFRSWRDGGQDIFRSSLGPLPPNLNLSRYPAANTWPATTVGIASSFN